MKRVFSLLVVVFLLVGGAVGCASMADLPPEVRAEIWLNEIEGWLQTVEVLIAGYGESTEPNYVFEQIVFTYKVVRPQILSTIKNMALRWDLTEAQEGEVAQAELRMRDIDVFLVRNAESGGAAAGQAQAGWWKRLRR